MSWDSDKSISKQQNEYYQKCFEKAEENDQLAYLIKVLDEEYEKNEKLQKQVTEKKRECENMKREWDLEKKAKEKEIQKLKEELNSANSKNCELEGTKPETHAEEWFEQSSEQDENQYEDGKFCDIHCDVTRIEWNHFLVVEYDVEKVCYYSSERKRDDNVICDRYWQHVYLAKPLEQMSVDNLKKLGDDLKIRFNEWDHKNVLVKKMKKQYFNEGSWEIY